MAEREMSLSLPLEEMVARYNDVKGDDIVTLEGLPDDFNDLLLSYSRDINSSYIKAVEKGALLPEEAVDLIDQGAELLMEDYSKFERNVNFIRRYDQSKVWKVTASLAKKSGETDNMKKAMEQAARCLLVAYALGGGKEAIHIKDIVICLWNAGRPDLVRAVSEGNNAKLILVNSPEEEIECAKKMGETNPNNVNFGVANVDSKAIKNARNN